MSAVEVTISGMLYDRANRTTQNVVLIGEATLTGAGIGGGPIIPGPQPPGIWPSPGHPAHPIAPTPPGIWPSPGHPAHPIAPGGPPPEPPPGGGDKPPPEEGGWGYVAEWSAWGYFPAEGQAGPK
jgi:hypothetical protein